MGKNKKNILIIGATGFIGKELTNFLVNRNYKVSILVRTDPFITFDKVVLSQLKVFYGNYNDRYSISAAIKEADIVINLIPSYSYNKKFKSNLEALKEAYISDTLFLEECANASIERIIYTSSGGAIYGNFESSERGLSEDTPLEPVSEYGLSKLFFEKLLKMFSSKTGIKYNILRISNPYGPGQSPSKQKGVISKFILNYINENEVNLYGDVSFFRDYIYISDLLLAFEKVIEQGANSSLILNIGSGQKSSLKDLVGFINQLSSKELLIKHLPKRSSDVFSNHLNIDLAKSKLGWNPEVSLQDGIIRTYEYFISKQ